MKITVNETEMVLPDGTTLSAVRRKVCPGADVLVYNGAPVLAVTAAKLSLREGDTVALFRRGRKPTAVEAKALLQARNTPGSVAKLAKVAVGIAGAGGLGSNAALALARSGIGRLIIADFDVVEPSNLNRQAYDFRQIGLFKVDALKENILRANPYVRVDIRRMRLTAQNAARAFSGADILIEALDSADAKAMLAKAFCRSFPKKPLILASGLASCNDSNSVRTRKIGPYVYLVGDQRCGVRPGMGLFAPRVGIAACHQANLALRLALGLH
ncbi:MAG: sulfur carrier protein ThiS adenylyltransferase ThiF [Elusimicrobia bacterium]|nr:sulfur carrier protein ThiS adenylyltransferase ThiF [Elusimicrobiota bacterium]